MSIKRKVGPKKRKAARGDKIEPGSLAQAFGFELSLSVGYHCWGRARTNTVFARATTLARSSAIHSAGTDVKKPLRAGTVEQVDHMSSAPKNGLRAFAFLGFGRDGARIGAGVQNVIKGLCRKGKIGIIEVTCDEVQ